jgi:hypothetical protein
MTPHCDLSRTCSYRRQTRPGTTWFRETGPIASLHHVLLTLSAQLIPDVTAALDYCWLFLRSLSLMLQQRWTIVDSFPTAYPWCYRSARLLLSLSPQPIPDVTAALDYCRLFPQSLSLMLHQRWTIVDSFRRAYPWWQVRWTIVDSFRTAYL